MKSIKFNRTFWHSILSVIIFGVFVWIAVGSTVLEEFFNPEDRTRVHLGNGIYKEVLKEHRTKYIIEGKNNEHGLWDGPTSFKKLNDSGVLYEEKVNMLDGKRHGVSTKTYADGTVYTFCYNMGEFVDCETQTAPTVNKESASDILLTKNRETVNELELVSGLDAVEVENMLDTMQNMMLATEFDFGNFDTIYQDVQEELLETPYDSIVAANAELSFFKGIELSKYDEFRIAVINRYLRGDNSLAYTLDHIHSNYINLINSYGYTNLDVENFCFVFDSLMLSYEPLNLTDPYLVDSLDHRMVRVLLKITGYDILYGLKSLILNNKNLSTSSYLKYQYEQARMYSVAATPKQVAQLVVGLVYYEYIEGDKIRKALMEAYAYQKGIVLFPTVTTVFQSGNSSSSVTISGNVTDDGGGDIITRGFVWGKVYNPNYRDNVIAEDPGTGNFQSSINGLSENETYYVRSFATNSAGTQYGNCVEFTTDLKVNAEVNRLDKLELNIYPNPASEQITLQFQNNSKDDILLAIIDLKGKTVLGKNIGNFPIGENHKKLSLSDISEGIYICRLTNNGLNLECKFIVTR